MNKLETLKRLKDSSWRDDLSFAGSEDPLAAQGRNAGRSYLLPFPVNLLSFLMLTLDGVHHHNLKIPLWAHLNRGRICGAEPFDAFEAR